MKTRTLSILLAACLSALCGLPEARAGETETKTKTTASGLQYEVLRAGETGTQPSTGDIVFVHYTGTFDDGSVFDTSVKRGQPYSFPLGKGEVIPGWDEGVALMTVGSRFRFHVPWTLAYGAKGRGTIGAKTDLNFIVDLLKVVKLPTWRDADPAKQVTTPSGLKYEVLKAGEGAAPTLNDGVSITLALWNPSGKLLASSAQMGTPMAGVVSTLGKGMRPKPPPFLQEAVLLMQPGAWYRFEVPSNLCWGDVSLGPDLPAKCMTVWELTLTQVNKVPVYKASPEAALKTTKSGLKYEVLREGAGTAPKATDTVEAHYTGWLTDGRVFDSSHARGETSEFPLNQVIPGWTEGVQLMKEGAVYQFTIPVNLAYGPRGKPPLIGPSATLVFLIELKKIKKSK